MAPRVKKKQSADAGGDDTAAAQPAVKRPRRAAASITSAEPPSPSPSASSSPDPSSASAESEGEAPARKGRAGTKPKAAAKPKAPDAKAGAKASAAAEPKAGAKAKAGSKAKAGAAEGAKPDAEEAGAATAGPRYYLMKSEPEEFSWEALQARPEQTSCWEGRSALCETGVRNAQARNIMKGMRVGDLALFYHSSCKVPGAVGLVKVVREAYPDHTAFDPKSKYHDPKSSKDAPKWWMVDVQAVRPLRRQVTLAEMREEGARAGSPLADMVLINRSRLSVQPVTPAQWERVMAMEEEGEAEADT